jgi:hypothetical protein
MSLTSGVATGPSLEPSWTTSRTTTTAGTPGCGATATTPGSAWTPATNARAWGERGRAWVDLPDDDDRSVPCPGKRSRSVSKYWRAGEERGSVWGPGSAAARGRTASPAAPAWLPAAARAPRQSAAPATTGGGTGRGPHGPPGQADTPTPQAEQGGDQGEGGGDRDQHHADPAPGQQRSNGSANTSNPASDTATVRPENATVRPALASLRSIAWGGASPAARSSRKRLASSKRVVDRQPQPGHGHHVDRVAGQVGNLADGQQDQGPRRSPPARRPGAAAARRSRGRSAGAARPQPAARLSRHA